ncbi:hypothetical protein AAG906_030913 [Vitis piasezkii]
MTTRGLRNPTLIQFTIDGRQGAIGARHIAEALRIPYEPGDFYSLGVDQERASIWDAPY